MLKHIVLSSIGLAGLLVSCGADVTRAAGDGGLAAGGNGDQSTEGTNAGGQTGVGGSSQGGNPWLLSLGDSNAIATSGYWWTYTDHNAAGSAYHAVINQVTSVTVALQPELDSDTVHGNVIRVSGMVPAALPWSLVSAADPSTLDGYWQAMYPDSEIPAYPATGVGFGFLKNNAVFDGTRGGAVGIAFDMKINVDMPQINVSMPMVGTDLPDTYYADAFPRRCQYYTASNTIVSGGASCFAYHRKTFSSPTCSSCTASAYATLAAVGQWKRYCALYSEMEIPTWANAATVQLLPTFNPTQLVKMMWDMYQPPESGTPAAFDVSIDNVQMVTAAQARQLASCDLSKI